ncbi:MAG: SipW-dependent-type signal peptide-containing protein [Oscillospiraceae bacterium]|nr:SipW-dependent-type signal peptide-containing protein [Oscillospiraceae bacterium]
MKKTTKILALALAFVLVVVIAIGATVAYLKDTETVKNTFTVGKVDIDMDEAKVSEYGVADTTADRVKTNTYKLVPGQTYTKDPIVYILPGSEKCYVFVKIEDGLDALGIEAATKVADQVTTSPYSWTALEGVTGVYYKIQDAVASDATKVSLPVFSTFKLTDTADTKFGEIKAAGATDETTIKVTAYAIQFAGFETSPANAWTAVSTAAATSGD